MPNGDIELGDFPSRRNADWTNVVWIITEQCNLGCPYCIGFKTKGKATSLVDRLGIDGTIQRFETLRERSKKDLYITITGGEPTMLPQLPELCKQLIDRKFVVELQSNMITKIGVKRFVDAVDPSGIGQIMATYHGWALDKKFKKMKDNYINNFHYAIKHGVTCVLKTVVPPAEVFTMGKKLQGLRKVLPNNAVILPWLFIKGFPKNKNNMKNAYPYAYTKKQHKELNRICTVRQQCQKLYRGGAGFFTGMRCDAGRGFIVITRNGNAGRCYTIRTKQGSLGNFMQNNIKLYDSPKKCTAKFCGTSFWGMWFGVNPWDYVPNSSKKDAYYCRFGPSWK
jgi:MoaA/NifB/PqqE/SkfB family radical SAM enzyme